MDAISNTQNLVVFQEVNPDDGTELYEFWSLESCFWRGGGSSDDPVVKCYVAKWSGTRDTGKDGLPHPDDRAMDCCSWSEAPEAVREQFRTEVAELQDAMEAFV